MTSNCPLPDHPPESLRWMADAAVAGAFEFRLLSLPDFHLTGDDYSHRFDPEPKQRFLHLLRERYDSGVRCKCRALKWDTVVEQKMVELGHYLMDHSARLDFSMPSPVLGEIGDREIRKRILNLTQQEARRLGIGKSTPHYLRRNAKAAKPFKIYGKVAARMQNVRA